MTAIHYDIFADKSKELYLGTASVDNCHIYLHIDTNCAYDNPEEGEKLLKSWLAAE